MCQTLCGTPVTKCYGTDYEYSVWRLQYTVSVVNIWWTDRTNQKTRTNTV